MHWRRKRNRLPLHCYRGRATISAAVCIQGRRRAFLHGKLVRDGVAALRRAATEEKCRVLVYCFMPDHVHVLAAGMAPGSDVRRMIGRFKQYSGYAMKLDGRGFRWQRSFYDHVLRCDEEWIDHAQYILENPVRWGLVADSRLYPFTGAVGYDLEEVFESMAP